MKIEIVLGVALVVVSIGNYILYTGLQNKITLLEKTINSCYKEIDLWIKFTNRQTDRLKRLEDECKYREKRAALAVTMEAMELLENSKKTNFTGIVGERLKGDWYEK